MEILRLERSDPSIYPRDESPPSKPPQPTPKCSGGLRVPEIRLAERLGFEQSDASAPGTVEWLRTLEKHVA